MAMFRFVRKALESMYIGVCDVIEHQKTIDPITKRTSFIDVTVLMSQPCRVSFRSAPIAGDGNTSAITQVITLFLSPDVTIPNGSKIEVTQNGVRTIYTNSSEPKIYESHQEIELKLFERWT